METRQYIPIREWVKNFNNKEYDEKFCSTQIEAGWYDWFCSDKALAGKTKRLGNKLKSILKTNTTKINQDTMYVWFKNNCPMVGRLYDDFRIADIETGNVIYTIVPKSGYKIDNGNAQIWGIDNQFDGPIVDGTWEDVINYFKDNG